MSQVTGTKPEAIGRCPECGADVYLHKSSTYFVCSKRLQSSCSFTINRSYLKKWGKPSISLKGMKLLLTCEPLTFRDFLDPSTGEPLNHPVTICLAYVPSLDKYGIDVKVLMHEWI